MRTLFQLAAIVAIAIGVGLYAFGRHLEPSLNAANPAAAMYSINPNTHETAALACGWGAGFITLGALGVVVPWIDVYVRKHYGHAGTGAP